MKNRNPYFSFGKLLSCDLISYTVSAVMAMMIRYQIIPGLFEYSITSYAQTLYVSLFLVCMLFDIVIVSRDNRKRKAFERLDPAELFFRTMRSHLILAVISVFYLYAIGLAAEVSRTVILIALILDTTIDFLLRKNYQKTITVLESKEESVFHVIQGQTLEDVSEGLGAGSFDILQIDDPLLSRERLQAFERLADQHHIQVRISAFSMNEKIRFSDMTEDRDGSAVMEYMGGQARH